MTNNNLLYFSMGTVLGSLVTGLIVKKTLEKKYNEQYEKQIEEMEKYYRTVDTYKRESYPEGHKENDISSDLPSRGTGILTEEERKEVRSKIKEKPDRVDYSSMYKVDPAEEESPEDDGVDEETADDYAINEEMNKFNEEYGDEISIITEEEAGDLPSGVSHQVLFYGLENDILTDEDGKLIEDSELLIGNCIDKLDLIGDGDVIHIMNYRLDTLYETNIVYTIGSVDE